MNASCSTSTRRATVRLGPAVHGASVPGRTEVARDTLDLSSKPGPVQFIAYSVGAAIGGFIGQQIGDNLDKKWETVPLPQLRVGGIPGGVILGSQFHF